MRKACLALISFTFSAIALQSPNTLARETNSATWEVEQSLNGPTGTVKTSRGSFKVVRFGTMQEPHPLYINGKRPADIATVEFLDPCCDARLTLRTGQSEVFNIIGISYRVGQRAWSSYGIDPGMPIVVRDSGTGELRQEYFPNYIGIQRITFDSPVRWGDMPASALKTKIASTHHKVQPPAPSPAQPEHSGFKIGEKVCAKVGAYSKEYMGVAVFGVPQYRDQEGVATVTAFVERNEGDRMQLRNGGVSFQSARGGKATSLDPFNYNGIQLTPGMLFWDKRTTWRSCW